MAANPENNALMQKIRNRAAQKHALKQGSSTQIKQVQQEIQNHGI